MSKRVKKFTKDSNQTKSVSEYYSLKTESIDALIEAHEEEKQTETKPNDDEITVSYTKEEISKYQKPTFFSKIPHWIKALFIKYWMAGAVCFFFYWGLGNYITSNLDLLFVLWLALGVITDILTNTILRHLNSDKKEYDNFMMLHMRKFWTFFVNIIYAAPVLFCVVMSYQAINILVIAAQNLEETAVPLGVEPLLFGLFYLLYDMAFIGVKDAIVYLVRKNKKEG